MNTIIRTGSLLVVLSAFAALAFAAGSPSTKQGKELFNSAALGTNGKSCATCHPAGKGLEENADADEKELKKTTNRCIEKALKGASLPDGSLELSSLVLFQKTLGPAKAK